jgi:hypothetical protein
MLGLAVSDLHSAISSLKSHIRHLAFRLGRKRSADLRSTTSAPLRAPRATAGPPTQNKSPALSPRGRGWVAAGAFTSRSGRGAPSAGGEGAIRPAGTSSAAVAKSREHVRATLATFHFLAFTPNDFLISFQQHPGFAPIVGEPLNFPPKSPINCRP